MSGTPPPHHVAAGRLAQLLADVIVTHAPHTAKIGTDETRRQVTEWLDELEAHSVTFVAPFLQQVLENSDPPEPVKALLNEAISPTAALSAPILQVFLYSIIQQVMGIAVGPFLQGTANTLTALAVSQGNTRPVDPAIIATAVGRGLNLGSPPTVTVPAWAYQQAADAGISKEAIDLAASIIGLPPAMQELFEMQRRGIIGPADVVRGLKEGDFRDDWIQYAVQLTHGWLTPLDFVRAAVQEQMTYQDASAWAYKTGLDTTTPVPIVTSGNPAQPDMFGLAYSIAGRPPGPEELARMTHRQIIPESGTGADALTFQQGIAESDIKTKWTDVLYQLSTYLPPPESVMTLIERGGITPAQAATYWADSGVPPELVTAYSTIAGQQAIAQDRLEAKTTITQAYYDHILTNADATIGLEALGYRKGVAADILAVVDFKREIQAINAVVRKVGTAYESFKLSPADAMVALERVGVPADQATNLLVVWDTLRLAPLRVPTPAEIVGAYRYKTLTEQDALNRLGELGYDAQDAAIVLSGGAHVAVIPLPPPGLGVVG